MAAVTPPKSFPTGLSTPDSTRARFFRDDVAAGNAASCAALGATVVDRDASNHCIQRTQHHLSELGSHAPSSSTAITAAEFFTWNSCGCAHAGCGAQHAGQQRCDRCAGCNAGSPLFSQPRSASAFCTFD